MLHFLIRKLYIIVLIATSIIIQILLEKVKLFILVFAKDFPVDFDLITVIFLGSIIEDLSGEVIHPLIKFCLIFHIHIAKNVQEVHVLCELITTDHSILYDWNLLNSDMDIQISLTHELHSDESVERNGFCQKWANSAGLSAWTNSSRSCAIDLGHNIKDFVSIRVRSKLTHEFVMEPNRPDSFRKEFERLKDYLFTFNHEKVHLKVLEKREVLIELVLLVVFVDSTHVTLYQL